MSKESRKIEIDYALKVEPEELKKVGKELVENGFDHLASLTGIDRPEDDQIELVYHVSSYSDPELKKQFVEIRTRVDREDSKIKSLGDLWPSSKYMEAETRDLLGVSFEGNEIRAPLILPEELMGEHPLRKDFEIPEEGIG